MPQQYKGYDIPAYTDDADAVKAFQNYTDSLDLNLDAKADLDAPTFPTTVNVGTLLTAGSMSTGDITAGGDVVVGTASDKNGARNITISTSAPTGGQDGDIWLVY